MKKFQIPKSLLFIKTNEGWETRDEYPAPQYSHHVVEENLEVHELAARIPFNNPEIFLRLTRLVEEKGEMLHTQVKKLNY